MKTKNLLRVALFFIIGNSLVYGWPMERSNGGSGSSQSISQRRRETGAGTGAQKQRGLLRRGTRIDVSDSNDSDSEQESKSGELQDDEESSDHENAREISDVEFLKTKINEAQEDKRQSEESLRSFAQSSLEQQRSLRAFAEETEEYWQLQYEAYKVSNGVELLKRYMDACREAMEAARQVKEANSHEPDRSLAEQAVVIPLEVEDARINKEKVTLTSQQQERLLRGIETFLQNARRAQKKIYQDILNFVKQREKNWDEHGAARERSRGAASASKEAEEKLLQTQEENSEENRAHTRLAQLAQVAKTAGPGMKKAGAAITVVGGVMVATPLAPLGLTIMVGGKAINMVGGEVEKAAPVLEEANKRMGELQVAQAKAHRDHTQEELSHAEKKVQEVRNKLSQQEKKRKEQERSLFEGECKVISLLAKKVCPRKEWNNHEWKEWIAMMLQCDRASEEIISFLVPCQENVEYLKRATAAAWERHRDDGYMQWRFLESKNDKKSQKLRSQYGKIVAGIKKMEEEQKDFLEKKERDQQRQGALETLVSDFEKAQSLHQANEVREKYLKNLEELTELHQQLEAYPAQQEELRKQLEAMKAEEQVAIKNLNSKTKLCQLEVALAHAAFKTDQEQFRRFWPNYDMTFRPYLEWELPFIKEPIEESAQVGVAASQDVATISIDPPEELFEEIEERGRVFLYRAKQIVKEALRKENEELLNISHQNSDSSAEQESQLVIRNVSSTGTFESPYERLLNWSLEQIKNPSSAEKDRWAARRRLDQCLQEERELAETLSQPKEDPQIFPGEKLETASESELSAARSESTFWLPSQKTRSRAATLFGGLTVIGEKGEMSQKSKRENLKDQFLEVQTDRRKAEEQWLILKDQAEQVRQVRDQSFGGAEVEVDEWTAVDRKAGQKYQQRQRLLQEKKTSKELSESWDKHIARWKIYFSMKLAQEKVRKLQEGKEQRDIALAQKRLKEKERLAEQAIIQKELGDPLVAREMEMHDLEVKYQGLLEQYAQQKIAPDFARACVDQDQRRAEEANSIVASLQSFDEGVALRWKRLTPLGEPGIDQERKEEKNFIQKLEEAERGFLKTASIEEGITKYREIVVAMLLQAARENILKMPKIFEGKRNRREQELANKKNQLTLPASSSEHQALETRVLQLEKLLHIDQEAIALFEKEKSRLDRVEQLLESILTAKKDEQDRKLNEAVLYYRHGDLFFWEHLTARERRDYNLDVAEKNALYEQDLKKEEEFLEREREQLDTKKQQADSTLSFITLQQKRRRALLEGRIETFNKRSEELDKKKEALCLEKMTEEGRKNDIQKKIKLAKEEPYCQWIEEAPRLADEARKKLKRLIKLSKKALDKDASGPIDESGCTDYSDLTRTKDSTVLEIAAELYDKSHEILKNNLWFDGSYNRLDFGIHHALLARSGEYYSPELSKIVAIKSYNAAQALEKYMDRWYKEANFENYYGDDPGEKREEYSRVIAQSQAALMYYLAIKYKKKCEEAARAYYESAKAYEGEVELHLQANEKAAEWQKTRAMILGGSRSQPGLGWLSKEEKKAADRAQGVKDLDLSLLGVRIGFSHSYHYDGTAVTKDTVRLLGFEFNIRKTKIYYKDAIEACTVIATILERAVNASIAENSRKAALHAKQAEITTTYYAAKINPQATREVITAYYKASAALDRALGQGLFSSFHLSEEEQNLCEQRSDLFKKAAEHYALAVDPKVTAKSEKATTIYNQIGEAFENEEEFLENKEIAVLCEQRIYCLNKAISAYVEAENTKEQTIKESRLRAANTWEQVAKRFEMAFEAHGNQEKIERYKKEAEELLKQAGSI